MFGRLSRGCEASELPCKRRVPSPPDWIVPWDRGTSRIEVWVVLNDGGRINWPVKWVSVFTKKSSGWKQHSQDTYRWEFLVHKLRKAYDVLSFLKILKANWDSHAYKKKTGIRINEPCCFLEIWKLLPTDRTEALNLGTFGGKWHRKSRK